MKKNTLKYILLYLVALPLVFSSCSQDAMDKVNRNEDDPKDVYARFILTDLITNTAINNVGGDFNTYLSAYIEHEVGTDNQLWDAEHRLNQPQLASTFNNAWVSTYRALRDARDIVIKCSPNGAEEGNYVTLGMGQVMAAYNLALLTDLFGDVPYAEALDPFENRTPKLDKQEALYVEIMKYLDDGLVNLGKSDRITAGKQDFLFGSSPSRWMKFAYGLKARYTMRQLKVTTDKNKALADVISFVDQSFANVDEQAAFNVYNSQNLNPLFDFQWSRSALAASKSIADKFIEREDPRARRCFINPDWEQISVATAELDAYKLLAPNGTSLMVRDQYLTSTFGFSQTASTQLLSYHEIQFLKAEAMQRLGKSLVDIEPVLKNAIFAAFHNTEASVTAAFNAPTVLANGGLKSTTDPIKDAEIESYFTTQVKPLLETNPLKEIAVQKYLAMFGASGESMEAYHDVRRWKALGENLIEFKNTKRFPLRLPYGNSETTANPNVQQAYEDGLYVYAENVWWAGGTR